MDRYRSPERPGSPAGWPVAPANAQHMGQRDSQQDAFGFSNFSNTLFARHGGYLAVLADGMGGLANGVWASSQAVRIFIEAYQAKVEAETPAEALRRAMHVANTVVHDEAMRLKLVDRMGTTLVAAAVRDGELHWISAGDSRVYLFEAGQLRCLSVDHSYGEVLRQQVARGEISLSEAQAHPMRNALTSYLGRPEPIAVDAPQAPLRISPGAWVLLCSDGLSGVLSEADIAGQLHGHPQQACDRLLQAAISRGLKNQDNTTVVLLHVPRSGLVAHAYSKSQARYEMASEASGWWHRAGAWGVTAAVLVAMTVSMGAWVAIQRLKTPVEDLAGVGEGVQIVQVAEATPPPELGVVTSHSWADAAIPGGSGKPNARGTKPAKPSEAAASQAKPTSPGNKLPTAGSTSGSTDHLTPDAAAAVAQRASEQAAHAAAEKARLAASAASAASAAAAKSAASAASKP